MADLLQLENVTAGYGPTVVVENVSFAIGQGDVVAVLGRNGVGKTSLLRTIVGQTQIHSGCMMFEGRAIADQSSYMRARSGIGYVPQTRDIFPSLTVEENLLIAARPGKWDLDAIYTLFPNLERRRRNGGHQISGGEQQMLSIGRALMGNPHFLLLDEPMEGLAPVVVEKIFEVLELLRDTENFAIIFVEQYIHLALNFAPRVIVLDRGSIVHDGRSADLVADHDRMATFFGATSQTAPA